MRFAHCRFCDDIRFEQGNKTSLMGIYGGDLQVSPGPAPGAPVILPKLCIATFIETGVDEPIKSLSITISSGDTIIQEATLPPEQLVALQEASLKGGTPEDPVEVISLGANLVLSPFMVDMERSISVTMTADGVKYRAGKLRIRSAQTSPGDNAA